MAWIDPPCPVPICLELHDTSCAAAPTKTAPQSALTAVHESDVGAGGGCGDHVGKHARFHVAQRRLCVKYTLMRPPGVVGQHLGIALQWGAVAGQHSAFSIARSEHAAWVCITPKRALQLVVRLANLPMCFVQGLLHAVRAATDCPPACGTFSSESPRRRAPTATGRRTSWRTRPPAVWVGNVAPLSVARRAAVSHACPGGRPAVHAVTPAQPRRRCACSGCC